MTGSGTSGRRPLRGAAVIRGRRDAVPYNGSPHPSAGGQCPHIAPPDKCAFCGGTHGSRPTGYAGHAGRDGGTPSPTTAHRTHPQGDDAHTSPRRTNAHFAAGHMGPALQGTPVMQDGTSGTPSPTTAHRTHPQGAMPTHCPAGSTKRQAKSQNKNYILFCDFGRCGG